MYTIAGYERNSWTLIYNFSPNSDSCIRSLHAVRQGRLSFDPNSFKEIVYPAYFSSYFEEKYKIIRNAIVCELDRRSLKVENFAYILTEEFFDKILGMFRVNNLRCVFLITALVFFVGFELMSIFCHQRVLVKSPLRKLEDLVLRSGYSEGEIDKLRSSVKKFIAAIGSEEREIGNPFISITSSWPQMHKITNKRCEIRSRRYRLIFPVLEDESLLLRLEYSQLSDGKCRDGGD